MLQRIREVSQGWLSWIIVILICVTFGFWGIHSYVEGNRSPDTVAKVNGALITQNQLRSAYEQLRRQQQLQLGADFNLSPSAEMDLKKQALDQLIVSQVLSKAAIKAGYRVIPSQVSATLLRIPAFQEEGRFSRRRFEEVLMGMGYNDLSFLEQLKTSMLIDQVQSGYINSAFSLPSEVETAVKLIDQKRDIAFLTIPQSHFMSEISISDAAIQAYYNQHPSEFTSPEQMSIQYVELSLPELTSKLNYDQNQLQQYYHENADSFMTPTRWKIERIFVQAPFSAEEEQIVSAKSKVELIDKRVKAGEDFSKLAKEMSDPLPKTKSALSSNGWVTRDNLDPESAKILLTLKMPGQVSPVFRSEDGFNIVKLVAIEQPTLQPFNKVRDQVIKLLSQQKASQLFAEQSDKLANLAYIHPNSLSDVASTLNLKIQETEFFSRQGGKTGIIANPKIIAAAFAPDVLAKNNSNVIELSSDTLVVIRVKEFKPAAIKPLTEVQNAIRSILKSSIAEQKIKQFAQSLQNQLHTGISGKDLAKQNQLTWVYRPEVGRFDAKIDSAILAQAFHLPRPLSNQFNTGIVGLSNGDYVIVAVTGVHDGNYQNASAMKRHLFQEQLENTQGQIDYQLYVRGLLKKSKIKVTTVTNDSTPLIPGDDG